MNKTKQDTISTTMLYKQKSTGSGDGETKAIAYARRTWRAHEHTDGKLDWEVHYVDGSVIRAHQHAAGALMGKVDADSEVVCPKLDFIHFPKPGCPGGALPSSAIATPGVRFRRKSMMF